MDALGPLIYFEGMIKPEDIKRHEREFWDANAEQYDARLGRYSARFSADLVDLMYPQKNEKALDVGGGSGAAALKLCERIGKTGSVTIIDLSRRMLALALEQASARGLSNLTAVEMDAEKLDFADGVFDLVTCSFAATSFPAISAAVGDMRRVLKPGGRIGFVVWSRADRFPLFTEHALAVVGSNSDSLGRWLYRAPIGVRRARHWLAKRPGPWGLSPLRFCSPGSLESELDRAGFRDLRRDVRAFPIEFPSFEDYWEAAIRVAPLRLPPPAPLRAIKEELRGRIPDSRNGRVTLWNEGALILARRPE